MQDSIVVSDGTIRAEDPGVVPGGLLEPGEQLLWTGRPAAEAVLPRAGRIGVLKTAAGIVLTLAVLWTVRDRLPISGSVEEFLTPNVLVPAVVVLLVIGLVPQINVVRIERYFRSLQYAMTDRRLLILEHGRVVDDFPPERLSPPLVRQRGEGYGDVVFGQRGIPGTSDDRIRDPVLRERSRVAFKALPIAQARAMEARITEWLEGHTAAAARATGEAPEALESDPVAKADSEAGVAIEAGHLRQVAQPRLGLAASFPASWKIEVRAKRKPRGKTFLDREDWRPVEDGGDWNVVRGSGPMHLSVECEVFQSAPTVTFESMSRGRLASLAGDLVEASPHIELDGARGFSVTRRKNTQLDPTTLQTTLSATIVSEKHTVLRAGDRQVYIVSTWPEDSAALQQMVDGLVHSIRLR